MAGWAIAFASSLGGALTGGVTVALLTQTLSDRSERRRMRRDVLGKLAGHRYRLTQQFAGGDSEFLVALNEIAIAYVDDKRVIDALHKFQGDVDGEFRADHLLPLMREMAKSAKLPADSLDPDLIKSPFVPNHPTERLDQKQKLS